MKARGFTLVEITAVLLIAAIAAAAVTLRSEALLHKAEMEDVVEQIAQFDHLTRVQARRHDRALRLVVDLDRGRLGRTDEDESRTFGAVLELPGRVRITKLLVRGQEMQSASVAIQCSRPGLTPTYAMLLEDGAGRRQWVLTAGLTGRVVQVDNEKEVRDILETLR